jgi:hypothetical protein
VLAQAMTVTARRRGSGRMPTIGAPLAVPEVPPVTFARIRMQAARR